MWPKGKKLITSRKRGFFMTELFTSESVCAGHPDKVCDQVSDAVVDAALLQDPKARVAVETLVTKNKIILAGEVTLNGKLDFENIAREQVKRLGYTNPHFEFTDQSDVDVYVHAQSPEIAAGVDTDGAGDQGLMFGFACKDTTEFMPLPVTLAHRLVERIDEVRETALLPYLRPDGKSQVTVEYKNGKPYRVTDVVIAVPHEEEIGLKQVKDELYQSVVKDVLERFGFSVESDKVIVNGTGIWHIGGPASDTGVTGRKIVVDTYGGYARVGGGAFSGKDPTKVDRSGAYAARYLSKNIVAQGLADKVEVGLAYHIGAKKPLMEEIETFGTEHVSKKAIKDFTAKLLDTSVKGILEQLDLRRPLYLQTAAYGHFGRGIFPWEQIQSDI
jgi:S-adenosylmethionine synthetase